MDYFEKWFAGHNEHLEAFYRKIAPALYELLKRLAPSAFGYERELVEWLIGYNAETPAVRLAEDEAMPSEINFGICITDDLESRLHHLTEEQAEQLPREINSLASEAQAELEIKIAEFRAAMNEE